MATGFVWDEHFFWFDSGRALPPIHGNEPYPASDRPDTKRRIKSLLDVSGIVDQLDVLAPVAATHEDLLRFHSAEYVDRVEALSDASVGSVVTPTMTKAVSWPL